jgi:siroheme synthase-like protein
MARQPRPCVCDLQLERCDASCNRKMLETTFYMAALQLTGRPCLVVGAGPVALEKIEGLLVSDARITVVAPHAIDAVSDLAREGAITWHRRVYEPADLDGRFLVIAATSDTDLNVGVFRDAEARHMLVNVVDVPPLCNFILPAIVRSGPIAIAISTSGASPALAKRLKREIAEQFGDSHARLAEILNELRGWAKDTFPTYEERRDFFEGIVNGDPDPIALLRAGDEPAVHALIAGRQREASVQLGDTAAAR